MRKLDWDDFIPPDLLSTWKTNFDTITKISKLKFKRCIVPEDAVNLDIDTLELTGHVVNHALSDMIKGRMHFTDSQIALCWISNSRLCLKTMAQKPSH